jgi:hypothetical protein
MLLYDSSLLELHFCDRGGDVLLVTFNEMGMQADGKRYWGDGLSERLHMSVVGFVSKTPNWFPLTQTILAISPIYS